MGEKSAVTDRQMSAPLKPSIARSLVLQLKLPGNFWVCAGCAWVLFTPMVAYRGVSQ